ncbi:MAG: beta-propeller domain-containing protein [Nitrososphaerota archaeon]
MKKFLLILMIALILTSFVATISLYQKYNEEMEKNFINLKRFSSYEELKNFINENMKIANSKRYDFIDFLLPLATVTRESFAKGVPEITSQLSNDYSKTNVQVEGIDEADIVKTDGKYIYIVSRGKIFIIMAYPPENAEILSQIKLNGTIAGLFINKDKMVIFENIRENRYFEIYEKNIKYGTSIKIYDISNRKNPILEREISFEGWYFDSRMIEDYVYVVLNSYAITYENKEVNLPSICIDNNLENIKAEEIYYADAPSPFYMFTTIISINIQDTKQKPFYETFLTGVTTCMYVSQENIYIAIPTITPIRILNIPNEEESTLIYRIRIEKGKIKCEASGKVPGKPLNQFSMDEYNGYFRIATTTGHIARTFEEATSKNHVYILNMKLNITGKLENLAPGERIYSARFMGNRCYLVTFKKVDPLFVIDLEDPNVPKVLGKLKIPGYSDYLHPYDENHLIGIGKETVEAEEGDFAWYQGVKISLFDVSDVSKPKEIAKYEIGDRGTDSPVLRDHKALLFDKSRKLFVLPVLIAKIDREKYPNGVSPNAYGEYVWQGACVFNISPEEGIVLKGGITHLDNNIDLEKSGYYFDSPYSVRRALYINNILYTISDGKIKMNSIESLQEINQLNIPFGE